MTLAYPACHCFNHHFFALRIHRNMIQHYQSAAFQCLNTNDIATLNIFTNTFECLSGMMSLLVVCVFININKLKYKNQSSP